MRLGETEVGDDVGRVQREIEHVFQHVFARRIAVAGKLGGEHVVLLGQRIEERVVGKQAAGPVQKHDRRPAAALEHAHLASALGGQESAVHRVTSAPGSERSGCRRFGIGLIHQRESSFHSGQRPRSFGITRSANSLLE